MKKVSILGSTGSIGTQTISVIMEQNDIEVVALTCGQNIRLMEEQIRQLRPRLAVTADEKGAKDLAARTRDLSLEISWGLEGLIEAAAIEEADIVVTAIVGMMGIRPTIAAIQAGKDIALANKETLVCAGEWIMPMAREKGVRILPVDSEHSAIFQSMQGNERNAVSKILLTASGGPFRGKTMQELKGVGVKDALAHPNWSMGRKITIDSATMINKGLEIMEACHLFGVGLDRIDVVVHPQSIIHSAVEYEDGSVMAQLGMPDMRLPIQYALFYPKRRPLSGERLDLFSVGQLTFERCDENTFVGLALARKAFSQGGNMPTVFNAANEMAVALFLEEKIGFLQIAELIGEAMGSVSYLKEPSVENILETEQETYQCIRELL